MSSNPAPLNGDTAQDSAAGGGLGGMRAADGAPAGAGQGATPSNPASPAIAGDAASLRAEEEARHLSDTSELKPLPASA